MAEAGPVNSVAEKFSKLDFSFNQTFLQTLWQIRGIVEGETDEQDRRQFELLNDAYSSWYDRLTADPRDMTGCESFYAAVKEFHELLMKRDSQLFTVQGDFFSRVFQRDGIDTPYLFDQLSESGPDADDNPRENLWGAIIALYRLSILIVVYLRQPLLKDIIDTIVVGNPDLTQSNIFDRIFSDFKGKRSLRKMIMKLLKSKEDAFTEIFDNLQKVIGTFSSEVSVDGANLEALKTKVESSFREVLTKAGMSHLNDAQASELMAAIAERNMERQVALVPDPGQLNDILRGYVAAGLDKINVTKVVKTLGSTMSEMMAAIQSKDEEAVQRVLEKAGTDIRMNSEEMERMQKDLEDLEVEDDADDDKEDPDEKKEKKAPCPYCDKPHDGDCNKRRRDIVKGRRRKGKKKHRDPQDEEKHRV